MEKEREEHASGVTAGETRDGGVACFLKRSQQTIAGLEMLKHVSFFML